MKKHFIIWIELVLLGLTVLFFMGCKHSSVIQTGRAIVCNAEHLSKDGKNFLAANDSSLRFSAGKRQTDKVSHSGKYSVITFPKKAFAFTIHFLTGPDWYYKISVWRKSVAESGLLVVTTKSAKRFYLTAKEPVKKDKNGWEKLELEVFAPPYFVKNKDILKVYVWNNSSDTVYFDDLKIERLKRKVYPIYQEEPLSIVMDTSEYMKLAKKRKIAFENGILQNSGNDWVKGIVFGDGKMMKAKLRLKGDWLDHLYGNKWSFRIKIKKKKAWRRLRVFSIQTPAARDFLMEWASHRFYESRDILTTRYGFVPVLFNNESRGMYAYEEHFVKQLVESRKRREGPIVKFSEDAFWQMQKVSILHPKWVLYPFFEASVIEPFSQSKTVRSPGLYHDFLDAQKLMLQYKNHLRKPADVFDLNKLSKYYAMLDLTLARHGMSWHNQRFYFNPMLCKLEPIAYDGYTDHSHENRGIIDNYMYLALSNLQWVTLEEQMNYELFRNARFVNRYLYYLQQFSQKSFVDSVSVAMNAEALTYDSLIRIEFPQMEYDFDFYKKSAQKIREYLPRLRQFAREKLADSNFRFNMKPYDYKDTTVFGNTPVYFVNGYLQQCQGDSCRLLVENYFPRKIILLGTGYKKKMIDFHFDKGIPLPAFKYNHLVSKTVTADSNNRFLFFMVKGKMDTYVTAIHSWPKPSGMTPQQELVSKATLKLPIIKKVEGSDIYIRTGRQVVDYPVVIPEGYRVHFAPGTTLNFIHNALFLSYSQVIMTGTKQKPIVITSSDFSANGFTVLQPQGQSVLQHVRFENLNTLNYKGWTLTGAVTFYEAKLSFDHTTIYRNQCEDALNLVRCHFELGNCKFEYTHSDAFDSDFSTGIVHHTFFTQIGNDATDLSGSRITIKNCFIRGVEDKGVSGGEDSHLVVENCEIDHANIGVASKDLSSVKVSNTVIKDCHYGVVLLQKKPEYGPASMEMTNVKFVRPKTKWLIEKGSYILFNHQKIVGDRKNLDKLFY